ncbi:MAG: capsule biosynthesis GfcC family protein [Methylocystis silviterrae]|uniref:capsule biosynthesis GfcC family protein n=1 Tax=Methylocystis silviterrae TaxID=2743612 RepID=UPI003BD87DB8
MNEEPKGRVEIILPGEETDASRIWVATGDGRVKVVKLSPWQSLMVTAALLLFLFIGFTLLSGAFLVLLVIAVVAGGLAYLAGLLGLRRPR